MIKEIREQKSGLLVVVKFICGNCGVNQRGMVGA